MPRRILLLLLLPGVLILCEGRRAFAVPPDSLTPSPSTFLTGPDTTSVPSSTRGSRSPGLAMLLSAVVPGAGQVYNESYWKVPIVVGFGVYFTSQWLHYNRLTTEARERYDESLELNPAGDPTQLALREFYKDQRDTYTWYLAILYILNIADAYVDASLYDFDVGDDLSVRLIPDVPGRLTVRVEF